MRAPRAAAALLGALAASCSSVPGTSPLKLGAAAFEGLQARAAPDADPGTVDLLVAPDVAFLERHGADAAEVLEEAVATLDRVLGPEAGLRFRIGGAVVFPSTPGVRDDLRLLWEARLKLGRGNCDVVAAFTGQDCGDRAGAAEPRRRLLLCADAGDPERNLLHEAAHLFGALDYPRGHPGYSLRSVMSYDADQPRTLALDAPNLARIRARRGLLPALEPDPLGTALSARLAVLKGATGAALLGALLCAESRSDQAAGIAPGERCLAAFPDDPAGAWVLGECLRVAKRREEAAPLLLLALRGIAARERPDGLERHAALEVARLAVDGTDGLESLMPPAEAALAKVSAAFPRDPEVLDLRASLRARAGDRAAAEGLYDRAIDAAPTAVYPWRHLAALGRSSGDGRLWLQGWRGAMAADPLDPVLGVRFVEDGLEVYPDVIHSAARAEAAAALDAAEAAFPGWERPGELRGRLR